MRSGHAIAGTAGIALAGLVAVSCGGGAAGLGAATALGADPAPGSREAAWAKMLGRADDFRVGGAVRTDDDLLLPEIIFIEIKSEICVESREPGSRFWSLDYDTCFVHVSRDTLDERGEYSVSVPCLDADREYESRHAFGDLRLVQRGPVSFLAESDAGWRHQETFTSSRAQRRDLVLTLDTDTFWIVEDGAVFRTRPESDSEELAPYEFGTPVEVVRFHQGWAECLMDRQLGWMEMRFLGTEEVMKERAPFRKRPPLRNPGSRPGAPAGGR